MPTLFERALVALGVSPADETPLTDEQSDRLEEIYQELRAEEGWAQLEWQEANPGWIGQL